MPPERIVIFFRFDSRRFLSCEAFPTKQLALAEILYPDLSAAPYTMSNGTPVFEPRHPGSPFLSGLYALDGWFSTLSRCLTSANNICSGIPLDRSSIRPFFNITRKNASVVLLRRGLAHHVCIQAAFLWLSTGSSTAVMRIFQSKYQRAVLSIYILPPKIKLVEYVEFASCGRVLNFNPLMGRASASPSSVIRPRH